MSLAKEPADDESEADAESETATETDADETDSDEGKTLRNRRPSSKSGTKRRG